MLNPDGSLRKHVSEPDLGRGEAPGEVGQGHGAFQVEAQSGKGRRRESPGRVGGHGRADVIGSRSGWKALAERVALSSGAAETVIVRAGGGGQGGPGDTVLSQQSAPGWGLKTSAGRKSKIEVLVGLVLLRPSSPWLLDGCLLPVSSHPPPWNVSES